MTHSYLFPDSGSTVLFADRREAGEKLAQVILTELEKRQDGGVLLKPIVYALPRGGLPVAEPIARLLQCPLDLIVAKKITRPDNPELAIGAVTADGHMIWARPMPSNQGNTWTKALHHAHTQAQAQLTRFADSRPSVNAEGAIAIIVDDGIATGMTIAAAAQSLREQHPAEIWICAPVAPTGLVEFLEGWSDRIIILETPESFQSVSRFYKEFAQVETEEALACLKAVSCLS